MCDLLVALPTATAGPTIWAKNSDRPPGELQALEWYPPRRDGAASAATYVTVDASGRDTLGVLGSRPAWGWGLEHGVNEAAVAMGNATVFTRTDPRTFADALTGMDVVRLALERAASAREAVDVAVGLIERYGQGGSGHDPADGPKPYWSSFLVADPHEAYVLDTSAREWAVEQVLSTRAVSNRTSVRGFDGAHRHPGLPLERIDPRLDAGVEMLARAPVTVAAVAGHLRSHAGGPAGYTVCMHAGAAEATTASMIVEAPAQGRPVARVLQGSPCAAVYVPLFVGRPIGSPVSASEWHAARPGSAGSERRVLDALEEELARDRRDDDGWAQEAWRRVRATILGRRAARR